MQNGSFLTLENTGNPSDPIIKERLALAERGCDILREFRSTGELDLANHAVSELARVG
jgi:hypothetical protein